MRFQLILALMFVLGSSGVCIAAPSSKPTSAPSKRQVKIQPHRAAVPSMALLQIQKSGKLVLNQTAVPFPKLVQQIAVWKKHKVRVLLETQAGAPTSRVLVVKTLMREYKLSWFEQVTGTKPQPAPVVRKQPQARPKAAPVQKAPSVRRAAPVARKLLPLLPWAKVPMKAQVTKGKGKVVEIRGLLWSTGRAYQRPLSTALVRYIGKQRVALGHLQSNDRGQFRYRLTPSLGATYRVSVLQGSRLMEFPAPLLQQQNGLLYLRITLEAGIVKAQTKANPHAAAKVNPHLKPRTVPVRRQPSVRPPAKRGSSPHAAGLRPVKPGTQQPQKIGSCKWDKLPLADMKGTTRKNGVEYRVQLIYPANARREPLATGLLVNKNKKRTPVARVRTDDQGCARYLVKADTTVVYEVALLIGARLTVHPLPKLKAGARIAYGKVKLPNVKARSTLLEQLSVIIEQVKPGEVRFAHVAQLFYQPTSSGKNAVVYLPLAVGARNAKMERGVRGATWKQDKLGFRLTGKLTPGAHRFLYSFTVPLNEGKGMWRLVAPEAISQMSFFFGRNLKPGFKAKLQNVQLGNPGQKRKFRMLRIPGMKKGQEIKIPVQTLTKPGKGLLAWIKRWRGQPNKKNKLVGLSVLLGISLLGLFWIFATPRRREEEA